MEKESYKSLGFCFVLLCPVFEGGGEVVYELAIESEEMLAIRCGPEGAREFWDSGETVPGCRCRGGGMVGRGRKRIPYSPKMGKRHRDEDEMEKTGRRLGSRRSQSVYYRERGWWRADHKGSLRQVTLVI